MMIFEATFGMSKAEQGLAPDRTKKKKDVDAHYRWLVSKKKSPFRFC